jgi:uncharacterized protein
MLSQEADSMKESPLNTRYIHARWEIRPRDGSPPIRGDLRARHGPAPESAVVLCHGFKGFKDWGFFPVLARALAQRGHAALSFDFSRNGVGPDGVDFSALELFAENTHTRNVEEIQMVLDAIQTSRLFPAPPRAIGLFGHSRGGGEAVLAAARDARVDTLVTWAAIASVERWAPEQIDAWRRGEMVAIPNARTGQQMPIGPGFWSDVEQNSAALDIRTAARGLAIPWLIVHGEADTSVPAEDARALFAAAGEATAGDDGGEGAKPAELLLVEDADHTFGAVHPYAGPTSALRTAVDATLAWFDAKLARREDG